ncbi:hypothetical protein [Flavobacterium acetivorans]|uniref:hypothetical protein n=1 Tax=Flavobacterium acetivorans TaxID=2893883 RepID=UPI001E32EB4C|nr:hypothetical protein [Flavobacterium sp. F-29]UFH34668.1 hypothetical protein LNP19_11280 [Flavobacterium sp. F-29]
MVAKKKAAELKSYYWTENANICEESIEFDESGYIRNTIVGIVEQNGILLNKTLYLSFAKNYQKI